MEVFVAFIQNNIPLVVIMAIAVAGIIGISAALIVLKIKKRFSKNKSAGVQEDLKSE